MSKTPKTDQLTRTINGYAYVPSIFARGLERENAELLILLEAVRDDAEKYDTEIARETLCKVKEAITKLRKSKPRSK